MNLRFVSLNPELNFLNDENKFNQQNFGKIWFRGGDDHFETPCKSPDKNKIYTGSLKDSSFL